MPLQCKGHDARVRLCTEYYIRPVAHLKLLEGQSFNSDTGRELTDSYYRFRAINKNDSSDEQDIICGYVAGNDFCDILGIDRPPLFNPLASPPKAGGGGGNTGGVVRNNTASVQLANAIQLILSAWSFKKDSVLSKILPEVIEDLTTPPMLKYVKAVNTILRKAKTTMTDIIEGLERANGSMRDFNFNALINMLNGENIQQYFVK